MSGPVDVVAGKGFPAAGGGAPAAGADGTFATLGGAIRSSFFLKSENAMCGFLRMTADYKTDYVFLRIGREIDFTASTCARTRSSVGMADCSVTLRSPMMRFNAQSSALAIGMSILSFNSLAFQPLVTDDTGTQGQSGNQLELAGTRATDDTSRTGEMAFAYTRGLTDTIDVFVELGRQGINDSTATKRGPTNPSIGAKWRFFENERKTSLAIKPIYIVPVSEDNETKGMGTGKASYEVSLIFTQEMGWGAVHANLVTGRSKYKDLTANEDSKDGSFSVAPVWNLNEQWKLAVDLGLTRSQTNSATSKVRFGEVGAIYSPNADLDFALGFIRETDRDTKEVTKSTTAGVTWRFK